MATSALARDTFGLKLHYDEMVDTPLDQLLEIGYADLHKNQAEFNRIAKEVIPTKSAAKCWMISATIILPQICCCRASATHSTV